MIGAILLPSMKLRDLIKMQKANDGSRSLFESVMVPELASVLQDWQTYVPNGVLIGGMGLSFHVKPRMTQDLDFLFLSDTEIPDQVSGFKRTRGHAFQHNKTHVEIEILTPEFIKVPRPVVEQIIKSATVSDGIKIASAAGMVASKLFRLSLQDKADIVALINSGRVSGLDEFHLPPEKMAIFKELEIVANSEREST